MFSDIEISKFKELASINQRTRKKLQRSVPILFHRVETSEGICHQLKPPSDQIDKRTQVLCNSLIEKSRERETKDHLL
jgi:hypothetical protein